jgi:pyruvate-formate lyase-activating enzyme
MLSGNRYSVDYVKQLIAESLQPFTYKVNFTGGEPLVQYRAVIELAKFVRDRGLRTYLESSCYDSARFSKLIPYIDICKVEFKMSDSEVVDINHYEDLLQNEITCLRISVSARKISYIKVVVTKSTNSNEFADLVEKIFRQIDSSEISGFVIQPSSGLDEPTVDKLVRFYDIVCPHYEEVRIIPQSHKQIGAR